MNVHNKAIKSHSSIRTGQSCAEDARQAVQEFHAAVALPDMALVLFFCSSEYDLDALTDEMNRLFTGTQVVGCTTAGEIGPAGYRKHSLSGASFAAADFTATSGHIGELQKFEMIKGQDFTQHLRQRLESSAPVSKPDNCFAVLLIDGLSVREEQVTRSFQSSLDQIELIGGSAGDDLKFKKTLVFAEGRFHDDSAVLDSGQYDTAVPDLQDPAFRSYRQADGGDGSRPNAPDRHRNRWHGGSRTLRVSARH